MRTRLTLKNRNGSDGDKRLRALLMQWKGVEPQADFEAAVWRRIRVAQGNDQGLKPILEACREWLAPLPPWVNVAAAAAGIIVGVGVGLINSRAPDGRHGVEPLLHPQTFAGSYLAMTTGRTL